MSVHRKGGGWVVRYRDGGRQRSRKFTRKQDADRFDREQARRRELGTLHTLATKPATLDEYVATWAATYGPLLAPRSRTLYAWAYDQHVSPYLGGTELHRITGGLLARWQAAQIEAGAGHETLRKSRQVLSVILRTAAEADLIPGNPVASMPSPKPPLRDEIRPFAPSTVESLREVLSRPRDRVLVSLLAYAGLRPGEARTLAWGHVRDRTLVIGAAKTRRRRTVRLLEPLRGDLLEWRLASGRPPDDRPVIPQRDGHMTERAFDHWRGSTWAAALETVGVPYVRPYVLRHSFASLLLHEGRSPIYVARQLGHTATMTLETYGHVIDELEDQPRITAEQAIAQARARDRRVPSEFPR